MKLLDRIFEEVHDKAYAKCKKKYRGSEYIYGAHFDDLFQEAVLAAYEYTVKKVKQSRCLKRATKKYVWTAIVSRFDCEVQEAKRKQDVKNRNEDKVKEHFHNEYKTLHNYEEVEVQNLVEKFGPKVKSLIRMLSEGKTIKHIYTKLDISSRKFYKIQKAIQKRAANHGYEKHESGSDKTRKKYHN